MRCRAPPGIGTVRGGSPAAARRSARASCRFPKATFAEPVPGLTVRYQRRTPLLQDLVESVGVELAGRGPNAAGPQHQTLAVRSARPADAGTAAAAGDTPGARGG